MRKTTGVYIMHQKYGGGGWLLGKMKWNEHKIKLKGENLKGGMGKVKNSITIYTPKKVLKLNLKRKVMPLTFCKFLG